ncbi:MAG: hypothetical protein ACOCUS_04270 [Polyangiales bacterium]
MSDYSHDIRLLACPRCGAPLESPAHQQQLRAKLAAGCAKLGDIEGAEAWLALLDPYSESIHADSAYRHARACVDTVRGDWPAVIRVLGETMEEVPIVGELGIFVDCLRANALGRMGISRPR